MARKVNVIEDLNGKKTVFIHDILFKGKRAVNWDDVEKNLRQYVGEFYQIEDCNKMIYIGKPIELDETEFFVQLKKLKEESKDESNDIRALVKEIVPTYHYADSSSIISIGRTPDMK